jgi:Rrf2 family protein
LPKSELILGQDLAAQTELPANYLAKILLTLGKAGIVRASRGRGGGYGLRRPAGTVTLYEVVELFDGPRDPRECVLSPGHLCSPDEPCSAHEIWEGIWQNHSEFLQQNTVETIAHLPKSVA